MPSNGQNICSKRSRSSGPLNGPPLTLEEKVTIQGGKTGYGLDLPCEVNDGSQSKPDPTSIRPSSKTLKSLNREFDTQRSSLRQFRTSERHSNENIQNPYRERKRVGVHSSAETNAPKTRKYENISHVVCSISENIARETCIVSMDASSPVTLFISKQCNGQSYAETIAYLQYLQPDEVLLNEGRKNSQLSQKISSSFHERIDFATTKNTGATSDRRFSRLKKNSSNRPHHVPYDYHEDNLSRGGMDEDKSEGWKMVVAIKFVPRTYFDQMKGAELVHRVARQGSYDPSVLEEYIFLSSSYAVLQYMQSCLGAYFSTASIDLCLHSGQENRMAIDRSTIIHLELLANAKTGKLTNSLIGTIDCTKTSVGSRLLRNSLVAPPTRSATINARLNLVDTFLQDEEFFYEVMAQLESLPCLNKVMATIGLSPVASEIERGSGKKVITARMASRGISALVCIKTTLSVVLNLARILEIQLSSLNENGSAKNDDSSEVADDCSSLSSRTHQVNDENRSKLRKASDDALFSAERRSTLTMALGGKMSEEIGKSVSNRHQLLEAILCALKNPALTEIMAFVTDIFTESTTYCKNNHAMRHQECFALKPNTDGIMDILRKAYLANVDDIYRFADEYAETFGTTVAVKETTARGYFLSIPNNFTLSSVFIQPVKNGKVIHCTTEDVHSLNTRAQENVIDLLLMTHERIQEVMNEARLRYEALAALSDAIALLDLCHSFADNVASDRLPWCRPIITDLNHSSTPDQLRPVSGNKIDNMSSPGYGALVIKNGRFGIAVKSATSPNPNTFKNEVYTTSFVPNDTYASAYQNFTVITGINGSGKSTYLKQIAIIVILAHIGSYVPADEAFIPIRDRIFTRLGNSDDQEHNISSFLQEMKESAFICNNITDRSLVLVDELGRATSNEDGVAIAWAIAEHLLVRRSITFFVTHYPQLCKLSEVYSNVQNQHLGILTTEHLKDISYTHKILPGACTSSADYGITMCTMCGWDQTVVNEAEKIHMEVGDKLPDGVICRSRRVQGSLEGNERTAETILWALAKNLVSLKENFPVMTDDDIRNFVHDLRVRLVPDDDDDVVEMIKCLLHIEKED